MVVLARPEPAAGRRGMSGFLLERGLPGLELGAKESKMGQCASPVGALRFDGIERADDVRPVPRTAAFT